MFKWKCVCGGGGGIEKAHSCKRLPRVIRNIEHWLVVDCCKRGAWIACSCVLLTWFMVGHRCCFYLRSQIVSSL